MKEHLVNGLALITVFFLITICLHLTVTGV